MPYDFPASSTPGPGQLDQAASTDADALASAPTVRQERVISLRRKVKEAVIQLCYSHNRGSSKRRQIAHSGKLWITLLTGYELLDDPDDMGKTLRRYAGTLGTSWPSRSVGAGGNHGCVS